MVMVNDSQFIPILFDEDEMNEEAEQPAEPGKEKKTCGIVCKKMLADIPKLCEEMCTALNTADKDTSSKKYELDSASINLTFNADGQLGILDVFNGTGSMGRTLNLTFKRIHNAADNKAESD